MSTLSSRHSETSFSELIAELTQVNAEHVEKRLSQITAEAEYVEVQARNDLTGGFWYNTHQDQIVEVTREFSDAFSSNPLTVAEGQALVDSILSSFFDPESVLASLQESGDVLSLDRLLSDVPGAPSIGERIPSPFLAKDRLGASACQNSLVASTIGAVSQVAAGAVSNATKAVRSVQTSLLAAINSTPGIADALASTALRHLLSLIGGADLVVRQLKSTLEKIGQISASMGRDDYFSNYSLFIREQQIILQTVEVNLAVVESELSRSGRFNSAQWDSAQKIIKDVSDALCRLNSSLILGPAKSIQLVLLTSYAKVLLSVLRRYQRLYGVNAGAIRGFRLQLPELKFDNLFAPIVGVVRCRLKKIVADMDVSIAKNRLFFSLLKSKQWSLETAAIAAFMRLMSKNFIPQKFSMISSELSIGPSFLKVESIVNDDELFLSVVISSADRVVLLATQKATANIGANLVTQAVLVAVANCDAYLNLSGNKSSAITDYVGLVVVAAPTAVRVVKGLLSFAESRNLTTFTQAVKLGQISKIFELDGLTSSKEGEALSLSAQAIAQLEVSGGNREASAELLQVVKAYQDDARSLGLLDSLLSGYSTRHIEDRVVTESVSLKMLDRRIKRASGATESSSESVFVVPSQQHV